MSLVCIILYYPDSVEYLNESRGRKEEESILLTFVLAFNLSAIMYHSISDAINDFMIKISGHNFFVFFYSIKKSEIFNVSCQPFRSIVVSK